MMAQASVSDSEFLDLLPRLEDGLAAAEVDVGRGQVAEALMVAAVVVVVEASRAKVPVLGVCPAQEL